MVKLPRPKEIADALANVAKTVEERLVPGAVVLDGFPRSLQLDRHSCGAQVCYAVLKYYGKARSYTNVKRELGTTYDGTDTWQLVDMFKRRGLRPRKLMASTLKSIKNEIRAGHPVVAYVDTDHWVAVYGYGPGTVFVMDPALNRAVRCVHSTDEFRSRWKGREAMAVRA